MLDLKLQIKSKKKTIHDKANQLVSSICDGKRTEYHYDAAGRLVREGEKTYTYGYLDKVLGLRDGKATTTYDYTIAGQLSSLTTRNLELKTDSTESFLWDGLALIRRGDLNYLNEPHAGGGAALLAGDKVMFNDMLGTTLGTTDKQDAFAGNRATAFGEGDADALFTGKPYVEGLGHAFLLRNYRADLGKWQTADPLGHPDGWNNFAYCNGRVTSAVDWMGGVIVKYRDVNENSMITNPNSLSIDLIKGSGDSGFSKSLSSVTYDSVAHQTIITINIYMYIHYLMFEFEVFKCEYKPHLTSLGVAGFYQDGFYEVILAHEKGHANYFFNVSIPAFLSYLYLANVDSGNYSSSELNVLVGQAWSSTVNSAFHDTGSNLSADQAVYDYFSFSPYWIQYPDNGDRKVWRKHE